MPLSKLQWMVVPTTLYWEIVKHLWEPTVNSLSTGRNKSFQNTLCFIRGQNPNQYDMTETSTLRAAAMVAVFVSPVWPLTDHLWCDLKANSMALQRHSVIWSIL